MTSDLPYFQAGADHDVLNRHHKRNRRVRSPSPTYLQGVQGGDIRSKKRSKRSAHRDKQDRRNGQADAEQTDASLSLTLVNQDASRATSGQGGKHSKTAKADVVLRPNTLAFFGVLWCKLIDEAKAMVRLHVATEDPFLPRNVAIDNLCGEIIIELVIKYEEDGLSLEKGELSVPPPLYSPDRLLGYYPEHESDMVALVSSHSCDAQFKQLAPQLFADTQTFRSELKKCAVRTVPEDYQLIPPDHLATEAQRIEFVKTKAAQLINNAQFLRGPPDDMVSIDAFQLRTLN